MKTKWLKLGIGKTIQRGFLVLKRGQRATYFSIKDIDDKIVKAQIQLDRVKFPDIAGVIDVFKVKLEGKIYTIPSNDLLFIPNQEVTVFMNKNDKGFQIFKMSPVKKEQKTNGD